MTTASYQIHNFHPESFKYKVGLGPFPHDVYSCFVNKNIHKEIYFVIDTNISA